LSVRDTRMMARALIQRWPVKPEYKAELIEKLMQVIASPSSSPREVTAAAKAIMAAEKQNQEDEHKLVDIELQQRNHRISTIAAELGIEESAILAIEAEASGDISSDAELQAEDDDR
jgi:hypothetical protein